MTHPLDVDPRIPEDSNDDSEFMPLAPVLDPQTGQAITTVSGYNEAVNRALADITDKWGDHSPPVISSDLARLPELAERARRIGGLVAASEADTTELDLIAGMTHQFTRRGGKNVVGVTVDRMTDYLPYPPGREPTHEDMVRFAKGMIDNRNVAHQQP